MSTTDEKNATILVHRLEMPTEENFATSAETFASDIEDVNTQPRPNLQGLPLPERYDPSLILGIGGMGEVYRVFDRQLQRYVAMKVIRTDLSNRKIVVNRFIEEAQICAQLQHPNIIPIYDIGQLDDERYYFTMKEVDGVELSDVIRELHRGIVDGKWKRTKNGWTLRRVIDVFVRVCEAMAHSHRHGVIHRDLKPSNIMVGELGAVWVMDWGVFKLHGRSDSSYTAVMVRSARGKTRMGVVAGTPAYMSPEQARGEVDKITLLSDVYSLGSILYEILTGAPPRKGKPEWILEKLRAGIPVDPPQAMAPIPMELAQLCLEALALDMDSRLPDAERMAVELRRWLDGEQKREQALNLVQEALGLLPLIEKKKAQARDMQLEAQSHLSRIKPWAPLEEKQALWQQEDLAFQKLHEAELLDVDMLGRLLSSLTYVRDLPEAHEALADYYFKLHQEAERNHNVGDVERYAILLRRYDQGRYHAYLKGDGRFTLITSSVVYVRLFRFEMSKRRLIPKLYVELGYTPLHNIRLPMGSYLAVLEGQGFETVHLPTFIERTGQHLDIAPDEEKPRSVWLPPQGRLAKNHCYIPAGWCIVGDPKHQNNPLRKMWIDGFIMQKHPITNEQYLAFLNDVSRTSGLTEALRFVPRQRGSENEVYGCRQVSWGHEFFIEADPEGDLWDAQWPVILINFFDATAYAEWFSKKTGQNWRLPNVWEWEKAARGVDGRNYPWGDFFDSNWACVRESLGSRKSIVGGSGAPRPMPATIDEFPNDISPYGVRGLAGNVQDWCAIIDDEEMASYRGGAWSHHASFVPSSLFRRVHKTARAETVGMRLVRDIPT